MDKNAILAIIDKFAATDLSDLTVENEGFRLSLRRETSRGSAVDMELAAEASSQRLKESGGTSALKTAVRLGLPAKLDENAAEEGEALESIVSPIVATFYRSPGPDAPAFVEAGKKVKAGDTLCILEAMKMMNHLEAEFDCEIRTVKAENASLVEYGQSLFEVVRL